MCTTKGMFVVTMSVLGAYKEWPSLRLDHGVGSHFIKFLFLIKKKLICVIFYCYIYLIISQLTRNCEGSRIDD